MAYVPSILSCHFAHTNSRLHNHYRPRNSDLDGRLGTTPQSSASLRPSGVPPILFGGQRRSRRGGCRDEEEALTTPPWVLA
jgi:hypothetical protein